MNHQLLTEGQEFAGRYRIERFLAEGGFGAVYVAEQLATEARVALKVLWPHVLGSSDAVEKFEQEARIAGRVPTEHIVRVIDAGFEHDTQMPFLVMELLIGEDLNSLVERQGALSPDFVVEYLRQVASALDKAHNYTDREGVRRPIVHRDLKPENIFLTRRDSGEPLVKVLDFGIAKVTSSTSNISREVKGTPLFMAYEQAAGGAITPQTDVWPLGLIAFFLLTGVSYWRTAHSAEGSLAQLFGEVLTLPLEPPSQRIAELGRPGILPAGFDDWFSRCVNRDAASRYGSAGEAIVMLGDVFGLVVQAVGSRPLSGSVMATTPTSLSVPTHVTPMQITPGPEVHATPVHATPDAAGPTLQSARAPVTAVTQGALSISGTAGVPPKRSPMVVALGIVGALFLIAGVAAVFFVFGRRGTASADLASTGAASPSASESPSALLVPTADPTAAAAVPSAAPEASAAPVPAPTATTAKPAATAAAAKGKPSSAPSTTSAPATATTAEPPPPTTTKPKPKSDPYDDR